MDEIQARIALRPTPLTWPVGIAGDFKGVLDRRTGDFIRFTRTAGGATAAPEEHIAAADAHSAAGDDWDHAVEESELLSADGSDYDRERFLSGAATPVLFTSATSNFGVNQLLDMLVELAPPPGGALDVDGVSAEVLIRTDGVMLVLFSTRWRLEGFQRDNPDVKLVSLVAAEG
jgi:peptide chain release factor 3